MRRVLCTVTIMLATYSIFDARSHTILVLAWFALMALAIFSQNWTLAGFFSVLGIVAIAFVLIPDYPAKGLLHGRGDIWNTAMNKITESPIFGHGAGWWKLSSGGCGHPHCSLLNLTVDYGLLGSVFAAWLFGVALLFGTSLPVSAGLLGLGLSTLTNSMRYPEVWLMISVLAGFSLKEMKNACQ